MPTRKKNERTNVVVGTTTVVPWEGMHAGHGDGRHATTARDGGTCDGGGSGGGGRGGGKRVHPAGAW